MKPSRRLLSAATAAVLGLAPLTLAIASPAAAATPLPIAHFSHLIVDQAHGHLFISGGTGTSQLLVTDLTGAVMEQIPLPSGATGLTLSSDGATLYAALPDSDAITAIDTATLTRTATYPTGTGTHPDSLAVTADTVWFGYGTNSAGNIGSLATDGTITLERDSQTWPSSPTLATTPGTPGLLVAAAEDWSTTAPDTAAFSVYTAGARSLTRTAHSAFAFYDLGEVAFTPDGKDVAFGSSANVSNSFLRTSDLRQDSAKHAALFGTALAVAPDGTIADNQSIRAYQTVTAEDSATYNYYSTGPDQRIAPHGLAWSNDETRLYAVLTDDSGNNPTLQIQNNPDVQSCQPHVQVPTAPVAPGSHLSMPVWDDCAAPLPSDAVLHVTRFDASHPDGVALPDLTSSPGAGWSHLQDTAPTNGPLSYRIDYAGDPHHTPASVTVTVPIAPYALSLQLTAQSVDAHSNLTLHQTITSTGPAPQTSQLQQSADGRTGWTTIATLPANTGTHTLHVTNPHGYWRIYSPATPDYAATTSNSIHTVRYLTNITGGTPDTTHAHHGQPLTFTGGLWEQGMTGWYRMHNWKVTLAFRSAGSTTWHTVTTAWTSADGYYTLRTTAITSGTWAVVFTTPDNTHTDAAGPGTYIHVS